MSNFEGICPKFFREFSLISTFFINIDAYENKIICIFKPLSKRALSRHQFGTKFCILE